MLAKLSCALPVALVLASASSAQVVINEFVYDHSGNDTDEFIELYNAGPVAVDLTGWVLDCEDDAFPSSTNFDIVIPADLDPGPGTTLPVIAPGGFFTIVNENANIPSLLSAADYIVPRDFASGEFLLENSGFGNSGQIDSIILRDASMVAQDAVAYEAFRLLSPFVTPTYTPDPEQIEGAGILGDQWNTRVGSGYLWSWSRIADGYDTQNNGYDFRAQPLTPGATNSASFDLSASGFALDGELAVLTNGQDIPNWEGTFSAPEARDYATAGIPASPFDDAGGGTPLPGALIGQFGSTVSGNSIGNTAFLIAQAESEMTFDAYVYVNAALTAAGEGRYWHIGMHGTAGQLFNLPSIVSPLAFNDTADVTGVGLSFVVTDTGANYYLVDYGDGTDPQVLDSMATTTTGWERIRVSVTQGAIEARIGGNLLTDDGAVMTGTTSGPGFGGLFIGGRKNGAAAGVEPVYIDSMLISVGNASAECFGIPTANTLGDPQIGITGIPYLGNAGFGYAFSGLLPNASYNVLLGTGFPGDIGIDVSSVLVGAVPAGLTLWVNLNILGAPAISDASGNGTFPVPLSGGPSLIGLALFGQGFQLDGGLGVPIPFAATKAIKFTIGNF